MSVDRNSDAPEARLLVSVIFADILGFSALADLLDPEQVRDLMHSLWARFDQVIKVHGGFLDKQVGDSLMIIWGAPETLEDDAERAVAACLELLEELEKFKNDIDHPAGKSLRLRIGIHTGLALAGHVGIRGEYTVVGETVYLAKRLEQAAEAGSLIVSEATYQAIRGAFQVKRLTPVQLEGTKQLVNIYQILEELPQPTKLRYRSKGGLETILVGRDAEMKRLASLFEQTKETNSPHLILVTGDVGVGKSRLLFEFAGQLETENPLLTVMSSRALDQTSRVSYYLWNELWSNRFELNEDDPSDAARQKTIDGVLTLWGHALGEITAVEAAHFLGSLIGVEWEQSRYLDPFISNPKQRVERAYQLLVELLYRASQRGPIVLILDDLHWADQGSLDLLEYIWKKAEKKVPLLILTCARDEFLADPANPFHQAERIALAPLPVTGELVRQAYPALRKAPENLLSALAKKSAGNPYYLEEMVKNVLASQITDLEEIGHIKLLPETLEGLLKSRLDSLSLEGRATAYFAAVAGRVFWKGSVLAAFRKSPGVTQPLGVSSHNLVGKVQIALDELMEKELAFLRVGSSYSGEREYIFKHSLLQKVAYQRLPEEYRAVCHLAVADWLAERVGQERSICVAYHYEKAGIYDKAQNFYTLAADHARSLGRDDEADDIQYLARTLPEDLN